MAIATSAGKNIMATAYGTNIGKFGALSSTAPGASAGTELSGGTYARLAPSWGAASGGVIAAAALPFAVPAGSTAVGYEHYDALTAGNYLDGVSITSQTFASAGTYSITPSYTQS